MNCNNTYCYWNYFDSCCHESEEGYKNATANELDCPSSLRKDFEQQLYILLNECVGLLHKRNMRELIQIKNFIELQREKDHVNYVIKMVNS
ncbi:hypothetical protein ABTW76_05940 [Paenibacillus dendritiformis]